MNYILSNSNEPSFNLAAEEYFLKNTSEEFFIIYINSPSVVIGRNQNPYEEVNLSFLDENSIHMFRRITGGGTVYHDHGNINYSFIVNGLDYLNDYSYFINKIIEPLKMQGVPLEFVEKSHIFLNNQKVSGNAQTFYKNRVLHHGTLLFDTDIENLKQCLKPKVDIESKSIKSNRVKVTNINHYIDYNSLIHTLLPEYRSFTDEEIIYISDIEKKYFTWEWNFAESPRFIYRRQINECELAISVRNGLIVEAFLIQPNMKHILSLLHGKPFIIDTFKNNIQDPRIKHILDNIKTLS